jgi:hypothetical protein
MDKLREKRIEYIRSEWDKLYEKQQEIVEKLDQVVRISDVRDKLKQYVSKNIKVSNNTTHTFMGENFQKKCKDMIEIYLSIIKNMENMENIRALSRQRMELNNNNNLEHIDMEIEKGGIDSHCTEDTSEISSYETVKKINPSMEEVELISEIFERSWNQFSEIKEKATNIIWL